MEGTIHSPQDRQHPRAFNTEEEIPHDLKSPEERAAERGCDLGLGRVSQNKHPYLTYFLLPVSHHCSCLSPLFSVTEHSTTASRQSPAQKSISQDRAQWGKVRKDLESKRKRFSTNSSILH